MDFKPLEKMTKNFASDCPSNAVDDCREPTMWHLHKLKDTVKLKVCFHPGTCTGCVFDYHNLKAIHNNGWYEL